jgi:hypothetical protein
MKVTRIQIVTSFAEDRRIVLTSGPQLQELQKRLGGKLAMLNVPEQTPPDTPRVMVLTKDAVVGICLNRFDITALPPNDVASNFEASIKFSRLRAEPILNTLLRPSIGYQWAGVVVNLEYPKGGPNSRAIEAANPVFDKLVTIKRSNRALASFQLQFGFVENGYNKNFIVGGYESRQATIPAPVMGQQRINLNLEHLPTTESGIQITIDVNNRATADRKSVLEDIKAILAVHEEVFKGLPEYLNLKGDI